MGLTKTGDLIQPLLAGPFKDPETETFVRLTDPTDHPLQSRDLNQGLDRADTIGPNQLPNDSGLFQPPTEIGPDPFLRLRGDLQTALDPNPIQRHRGPAIDVRVLQDHLHVRIPG